MSSQPIVPQEITESFNSAMRAYEACERTLNEYWYKYDFPSEKKWSPWPIANELRYVGQHICRFLCSKDIKEKQTEIAKARNHCDRATHDAHDIVILCFSRAILDAIRSFAKQNDSVKFCNSAKKEFSEICNAIAKNNRKKSNFATCRGEHIQRLTQLFRSLMKGFPPRMHKSGEKENVHEEFVVTSSLSKPTHEKVREVFNKAEGYLKKYELVSSEAYIFGIIDLFDVTHYLVKSDFQSFMKKCHLARVDALMEIASYFSKDMRKKTPIILQERSMDEEIAYLEYVINSLEKQWYGESPE